MATKKKEIETSVVSFSFKSDGERIGSLEMYREETTKPISEKAATMSDAITREFVH